MKNLDNQIEMLSQLLKSQDQKLRIKTLKKQKQGVDFVVQIKDTILFIETKKQVLPQDIQTLRNLFANFAPEELRMVIADYISPNAKEILTQEKINYLDKAGNIKLKLPDLFIHIEGKKSIPVTETEKYRHRAFTKSGAAVIFQFLVNPESINEPQRAIAEKASVSLGTIPKVIDQLLAEGYLVKKDNHTKKLVEYEKLLNRWVEVANSKLIPANYMQRFTPIKGNELSFFKNGLSHDSQWAGEAGAAMLTKYLRPQKISFFTTFTQKQLMIRYELKPSEDGPITVYKKFWNDNFVNREWVDPVLIFAQLINSKDSRNQETAQLIFNDYIKPKL